MAQTSGQRVDLAVKTKLEHRHAVLERGDGRRAHVVALAGAVAPDYVERVAYGERVVYVEVYLTVVNYERSARLVIRPPSRRLGPIVRMTTGLAATG